jgi:hypothetical protein
MPSRSFLAYLIENGIVKWRYFNYLATYLENSIVQTQCLIIKLDYPIAGYSGI